MTRYACAVTSGGTVLLSAYTGQARPAASASVRIIPSSFFTCRTPHLCFQRFHRKQVKVINGIIQFVYHKCKPSAAYFQCFHIFGGSCLPASVFASASSASGKLICGAAMTASSRPRRTHACRPPRMCAAVSSALVTASWAGR